MKKLMTFFLAMCCIFCMTGCLVQKKEAEVLEKITTDFATYYKMSDGGWKTDTYAYQYRLEITGRLKNAVADITYVYLSNIENISFEQAWKAAGLSSNLDDYFTAEEAVLVDTWVHE